MIYAMEYYGNNDYRDYLAHHGVKGMKWGKHLFGLLGGNYRDQYKSYSSKASALRKISDAASNASSYASKKRASYANTVNKSNVLTGAQKRFSNTASRFGSKNIKTSADYKNSVKKRDEAYANANALRDKEAARQKTILNITKAKKNNEPMFKSSKPAQAKSEADAYREKLGLNKTYEIKGPRGYGRTASDYAKTSKDFARNLNVKPLYDKAEKALNTAYGKAGKIKSEYDTQVKNARKAEHERRTSNGPLEGLANRAFGKAYAKMATKYDQLGKQNAQSIKKEIANAKKLSDFANTGGKKANDFANSTKAKLDKTERMASEAKSKWEKSIAYRVETVLKRFTGKLSSVGANIINRGRSIIDRFLRRKKKNS